MFLCPRHLCRPYFELLELFEHCDDRAPPLHEWFGQPLLNHSVPPAWVVAEEFILARYNGGQLLASSQSDCGLIREMDYNYAIARGNSSRGWIQCYQLEMFTTDRDENISTLIPLNYHRNSFLRRCWFLNARFALGWSDKTNAEGKTFKQH